MLCQRLSANFAGCIRNETINGKRYVVAPVTLIVPGVLQGSAGALLYPAEEVRKKPDAWNGVPITIGHPMRDGRHVSARNPGVQIVGHVRNAGIKGNKLVGEAVFDASALERVDKRILQALRWGQRIEVSTGLFTDREPAQNGANHDGKPYSFVARNYQPDHLAILPDQVGACSVRAGCGVNNCGCEECNMTMNQMAERINYLASYLGVSSEDSDTDDLLLSPPMFNIQRPADYDGQLTDEILPLPVLNYRELSWMGQRERRQVPQHETEQAVREDDGTDDDILELPTLNYEELSWKGQRR